MVRLVEGTPKALFGYRIILLLVTFFLFVAMPFVPSSFLLLVVRPGAPFVASDRSYSDLMRLDLCFQKRSLPEVQKGGFRCYQ